MTPGAYIVCRNLANLKGCSPLSQNLKPGADFKGSASTNVAFLYGFNTTIVPFENGSAKLPSDIAGQSYAVLTYAKQGEVLTIENTLSAAVPFFVRLCPRLRCFRLTRCAGRCSSFSIQEQELRKKTIRLSMSLR